MKRNCIICGEEFEITTNAHHTKTCEKCRPLRRRLYMREYMTNRYRTDPVFRRRMIEQDRRYREKKKEEND